MQEIHFAIVCITSLDYTEQQPSLMKKSARLKENPFIHLKQLLEHEASCLSAPVVVCIAHSNGLSNS